MYFTLFPLSISDRTSSTSVMSPSMVSNWSTSSTASSSYISSSTSTSFTPTYSWAHTIPTYMPWTTTSSTPLMHFTAPCHPDPCTSQTATCWELLNNLGTNQNKSSHQHLKRKSDSAENLKPTKQYISEEKMVAHLNELHISNGNNSNAYQPKSDSPAENKLPEKRRLIKSLQELEAMLSDDSGEESDLESGGLTLSPELKKLVQSDILLSGNPLKELKEPSMAVVLWQPPRNIFTEKLKTAFKTEEAIRNLARSSFSENNNNDTIVDRNCTIPVSDSLSSNNEDRKTNISVPVYPQLFDATDDDMDL